jgi:hypothetical protein
VSIRQLSRSAAATRRPRRRPPRLHEWPPEGSWLGCCGWTSSSRCGCRSRRRSGPRPGAGHEVVAPSAVPRLCCSAGVRRRPGGHAVDPSTAGTASTRSSSRWPAPASTRRWCAGWDACAGCPH